MSKYKNLGIIVKGIKFIKELSPGFLALSIIQACLNALLPFINIYMSAIIMNAVIEKQEFRELIYYVLLMLAMNLICGTVHAITTKYVTIKQNKLFINYDWVLSKKMLELDYADVESSAVQELREKINQMQNVNGMGIWNLVLPFKTLVQNFFTVIFSVSIFTSLFLQSATNRTELIFKITCSHWVSALLGLLIFFNIFINLFTVSKSTKKVFDAFAGLVPFNRVYTYYIDNYIDTYHSGKDIRLYNQSSLVNLELNSLIRDCKPSLAKLKFIEFKYTGIGTVSTIVINLFVYLLVGLKALAGAISVGSIIQYIGGINQFISGLTSLISQFTVLKSNNIALEVIFEYLNKSPSVQQSYKKVKYLKSEIEFKNVSFTYPGTEKEILHNLSLKIKKGEKLAIVGMNGSGKTTMIKLLCRLYDVDKGVILLDGENIANYDKNEYQKLFSIVFQDFQLFAFALGQNVAASKEFDREKALDVLNMAGMGDRLKNMTLDTTLYKDFDVNGVEISGGEAQKIAIARAQYKDSSILILDEPTSALDPIAEYEIYKKLNSIAKDKTAIFISHRMSSCRFCDRIAVFDEGELIQLGSHESLLMQRDGKYYELWNAQEQYYN